MRVPSSAGDAREVAAARSHECTADHAGGASATVFSYRGGPRPTLHDPLQLRDAFGQRGRTRLQDVGGLDLVDVAIPHRRHLIPSGASGDLLGPNRFAAPRADDDV